MDKVIFRWPVSKDKYMEIEKRFLDVTLKSFFHTIVFQRTLKGKPIDVDVGNDLELTIPSSDNEVCQSNGYIEKAINEFKKHVQAVQSSFGSKTKQTEFFEIYLSFFKEKKKDVVYFWKKNVQVEWETWELKFKVLSNSEINNDTETEAKIKKDLTESIQKGMKFIINKTLSKIDHIPQQKPNDKIYPFKISFQGKTVKI